MAAKADIKALIFDLGNTLLHFDGEWPEVMARADKSLRKDLQARGFELDEAAFLKTFRERLNTYYVERESEFIEHTSGYLLGNVLGEFGIFNVIPEIIDDALKSMYAITQQHWLVEEDAHPTLSALKQSGYAIGYVSNASNDADVQNHVDRGELRQYTDFVISSAACGVRKPDAHIFEIALSNWDFQPAQVAMIGDTLGADILGALNAGLYSIWITRRADTPGNRDHAASIHPNATLENLSQIPAHLASLR